MRLRTLTAVTAAIALIGGGIWYYGSNGGRTASVGAGGLPLIKADTSPVKVPPEEPEGEIIPNADSTVYAAMGNEPDDPSMSNITPPEEPADESKVNTEFAGFRTGFNFPQTPERKTESLFADTQEKEEPKVETGGNKYLSGIAPEAIKEEPAPKPEPEPAPEPVREDKIPEPEPAPPPAPAPEPEVEETAEPLPPSDGIAAKALEAQEKILITPQSKPPTPKLVPDKPKTQPKPEPKAEPKPEPKAEPKPKPEADFIYSPKTTRTLDNVVADVTKQPDQTKPATAPSGGSGYYIQLASIPASANARDTWGRLQGQYPSVLNGLAPNNQTITIPNKGDFIRVQAGPMSQSEANNRCAALRKLNPQGGCLVVRR